MFELDVGGGAGRFRRQRQRPHHVLAGLGAGHLSGGVLVLEHLGLDRGPQQRRRGGELALRRPPQRVDLLFETRVELAGSGDERGAEDGPGGAGAEEDPGDGEEFADGHEAPLSNTATHGRVAVSNRVAGAGGRCRQARLSGR